MTLKNWLLVGVLLIVLAIATEQSTVSTSSGGGLLGVIEGALGVNLSASQIAEYAAGAGWFGDDLVTAVAIALAESGGNVKAYNPEIKAGAPTGLGSYGLWQVYSNKHPDMAMLDLFEPASNAAAAFLIYQSAGSSFRPWATYTQENPDTLEPWYMAHLSDARAGVDALPGSVSA